MTPVYLDFLDILQTVFRTIYYVTLGPIMGALLEVLWSKFSAFVVELFFDILLTAYTTLLEVVAVIDQMITLFSGLGSYNWNGVNQNANLFEFFFGQSYIGGILALLTIAGVVLAVIFTIYSTGKSIADSALDPDYKPISKVLGDAFKTAMTFAATPILCILIIQLSSIVLSQVTVATNKVIQEQNETTNSQGVQLGTADIMFQVFTQDAIVDKEGAQKIYDTQNSFQDMELVKKSFNIRKISYVSAFLAILFTIIILGLTVLGFVRRIFEILLLYVVSPLFTATIPLDSGAKFKRWREMFIARVVSAFGPIFTMKLFLILMPLITTSKLQLSTNSAADWMMKLLLIIGAIYSIYVGRHMVMEIFSDESSTGMRASEGITMSIAKGIVNTSMGKGPQGQSGQGGGGGGAMENRDTVESGSGMANAGGQAFR